LTTGDVAVCLPAGGAVQLRARTLASVRARTPADVPVLEPGPAQDPFGAGAASDVVLIRPGCVVAEGWLEGLREAAYASATTATATALTQHDLGSRSEDGGLDPAAAKVRAQSLRLRPRLTAAGAAAGICVYVRRSAIELIGPGGDFWAQCVERGLAHVLADDVLVLDPAPVRPAVTSAPTASTGPTGPLARARSAARRALDGMTVTIDARILTGPTTGTHVHVIELIAALARTEKLHLTAIVPDAPSPDAVARLTALSDVSLCTYTEASRAGRPRADVVHRPFQLSNAGDLPFLASLGDRLALTQQDLIAYHNPSYFPTSTAWEEYRRLTRLALDGADRVLFFSAHARDDALAEDLVTPARASVVHLGVDHPRPVAGGHNQSVTAPAGAARLPDATPALLCLGTDFQHKNRVFALRLLTALRTNHGWDGVLVLAGPAVAHGSSRQQEARLLAGHPDLAGAVLDVGAVSEAEKDWLYERAALVVYPSVLEGFGLVPFEAAAHRVPCLWAPGSSLSELLPDEAAGVVPWDEEQTAERALALLGDERAREHNLAAIDAAAAHLTWDATATRALEVYQATADAPAQAWEAQGSGLSGGLSEDAARLVGPGGELPASVHRPLLALTTHRRIAAPVFGALKLGYRASYELRRVRRPHRRK
jgi:glycosyltransferase involved in cell wall biosynthesis